MMVAAIWVLADSKTGFPLGQLAHQGVATKRNRMAVE